MPKNNIASDCLSFYFSKLFNIEMKEWKKKFNLPNAGLIDVTIITIEVETGSTFWSPAAFVCLGDLTRRQTFQTFVRPIFLLCEANKNMVYIATCNCSLNFACFSLYVKCLTLFFYFLSNLFTGFFKQSLPKWVQPLPKKSSWKAPPKCP